MSILDLPQAQQDILAQLKLEITQPGEEGRGDTRILLGRGRLVLAYNAVGEDGFSFWRPNEQGIKRRGYSIFVTELPSAGHTVKHVALVETLEEVHDLIPALVLEWLVNYGAMFFPGFMGVSLHALREFTKSLKPLIQGH